jgi:hypothetical protein
MTALRPLPVGIQDFSQLREGGFAYVDKTELVHHLVTTSKAVFLSRPRRFGKSLLVSVFQNLYEGRRELFQGLWIEDNWNWEKKHPVVRISFGTGKFQDRGELVRRQLAEVKQEARRHGIELHEETAYGRFSELLQELSLRGSRPVVLIDEYDKPILQCLEGMRHLFPSVHGSTSSPRTEAGDSPRTDDGSPRTDEGSVRPEPVEGWRDAWSQRDFEAREEELSVLEDNRQQLRAFYSCLKDASPEFLFLTGVSRLAKASVFSELNHLRDITWEEDYAGLCGIAQGELETDFAAHLESMADKRKMSLEGLLERFRKDYNGFRFAAGEDVPTVYNPFSTCKALTSREFGSYWTETGTPEFLVRLMRSSNTELADVEGVLLPTTALSSLDPERPEALPLLLQTGYLTITGWEDGFFRLGFPNQEVRTAFVEHLLKAMHGKRIQDMAPRAQAMAKALRQGDLERFLAEMKRVFTGIAYQLDDAHEKRYHGLFQAMCNLALNPPALVLAEVPNALGRSDLVVDLPEACWIFEFKRDTDTTDALRQIAEKEYANHWEGRLLSDGAVKPVHTVAVTFGTRERNIVGWETT